MFSRRIAARLASSTPSKAASSSLSATTLVRPFSNTAWQGRTPALSDVQPGNVENFDAKQREFRNDLAEKSRKQKEDERQSPLLAGGISPPPAESPSATATASTTTTPSPFTESASLSGRSSTSFPTPSDSDSVHPMSTSPSNVGLGSLSIDSTGEAARRLDESSSGAKKTGTGRLSSLIYGTEEGREMDREIERSFSQVLARGKYVHSIVFHEVKPDKVDEYVQLVGGWYPRVAADPANKVHLVGSWRTEVGDCDTFVHIWEYQRYEGYHASLHNIQHNKEFYEFDRKLKSLIHSKKTSLMQEFRFWPTSPPRQLGGVFELRSYTLHPGNLLEWETHWQKGLAARREVMEGVGAWFVQIGDLNMVHHLWQFADLEERRARREQSWSVPGWGETVHKTVPLIQTMKSRIMVPMPWSPIG